MKIDKKDALRTVQEIGLYICPELVDSQTVSAVKEQTVELFKTKGTDDYKFGAAMNLGGIAEQDGAIADFFNRVEFHDMAASYGLADGRAVMATHEYRNDQGVERNGDLHFDRTHTFKFFLYLTDCYEDDGAFRYCPESRSLGETLRQQATQAVNANYGSIANRMEIDYPHLNYTAQKAKPLEGPAGTLFIFDTDTLHMGGILQDGHERMVIRSHYV